MLRYKDRINFSEIQDFFTSSEKASQTLFTTINSLKISGKLFADKINTRYSGKSKLLLMILFPFFEIRDISQYVASPFHKFLEGGKDIFYRFLNDHKIDWRTIVYHINLKLIRKVEKASQEGEKSIKCLIIDDTDFPKTGRQMELIGKIFSHVTQRCMLGFKGLFLCYHDGKSLFPVDFSLHGEKGKNAKKPFGLTQSELKKRYHKKREKTSAGQQRVNEYFQSKIDVAMNMIARAIRKGLRPGYILVDSWFTCTKFVRFVKNRRIKCHFLGMIKMGKTNYEYNGKSMTSKEIAHDLKRKKKTKKSKKLKCKFSEVIVTLQGMKVKLFFCKTSHRGNWHGMLSTNLELSFEEAYKIYSTRWSIEVYFKESKQYLGLGKCQSQNFDAQIAHTEICMLQYSLLSVVKRLADYETIGGLFREVQANTRELTINERIWQILKIVIVELAEILEIDIESFMEKIFAENERLLNLFDFKSFSQTG